MVLFGVGVLIVGLKSPINAQVTSPVEFARDTTITPEKMQRMLTWLYGEFAELRHRTQFSFEETIVRTGTDSVGTFHRENWEPIKGFTVYDIVTGSQVSVRSAIQNEERNNDLGWFSALPDREYRIVIVGIRGNAVRTATRIGKSGASGFGGSPSLKK